MKYSYNGFVFFVVVLFNLAGNLDAAISSNLNEITEVEKLVTSRKYQEIEEALIMKGLDKDSRAAQATIQAIRKEASKLAIDGDFQESMNLVLDSILTAVRTFSTAELLASDSFETNKNLAFRDPEAAIEAVRKSTKFIRNFLLTSAVPILDAFGSALALAGGSNHEELQKGMTSLQYAGTAILASLGTAERIATMGIEAGGSAIVDGLKAAREAVATGGSAAFEHEHKSARYIIESFKNPDLNVLSQKNRTAGILKSLKSEVSIDDLDALAAIDKLNNGLKSLYSVPHKQSIRDAANIMTQALTSTILETAEAMAVAKKALKEAAKLAYEDIEAAANAVLKGIETAQNEVVHGSSIGFLGFGAAREIAGAKTVDGLIPAMIELIIGRIAAYDDLILALETALIGIRAGVADQGINAAIQICKAAGNALHVQFADSGIMALDVFRTF